MTNRDRYKQAFAAIPISDDFSLEALHMKKISQKRVLSRVAAIAAACVLLFGGAATAYAADLGGIQRTVQIWLHGVVHSPRSWGCIVRIPVTEMCNGLELRLGNASRSIHRKVFFH